MRRYSGWVGTIGNSRRIGLVAGMILVLAWTAAMASSKYPSSSLEVVVTWPAGGGTDIAARNIIQYVEKDVGQRMNVINIPGGGGAIGYVQGAKKKPDGYHLTLLQFDILSVQAQGLAPVSYKDFDPIAMFADQPIALMVRGDSPFKTLNDFIKAAKERQLKMAGTNIGGVWHQASTLMSKSLGISYTYIPFSGIVEALPAVLGKHVDASLCFLSGTTGSLKSRDVRVLAVMAKNRLQAYPQFPTFKELGYDLEYAGFYGIAAPKGVPREAITVLEKAFEKSCRNPSYQADARNKELNPTFLGPAEFEKFLGELYPRVEKIIKAIEK